MFNYYTKKEMKKSKETRDGEFDYSFFSSLILFEQKICFCSNKKNAVVMLLALIIH